MKIQCECGQIIPDAGDRLPFKAHIIGDHDYYNLLDAIDEAIESKESNREALCMKVRRLFPSRTAFECCVCGRLYFDDKDGNLVEYSAANGDYNKVFDRE